MPQFVFLWTDAALWLLLIAGVVGAARVRRQARMRRIWQHVAQDAPAMCAALVLLPVLCVALMDSVHFRLRLNDGPRDAAVYDTRTLSLLDVVLERTIAGREQTYSAPLAYRSFQKTTISVDGQTVRDFPRLAYGGAHLTDPQSQWLGDVLWRAGLGGGAGLGVVLAMLFGGVALVARRAGQTWAQVLRAIGLRETALPWRAMCLTAGVLAVLIGAVMALWPWYHVLGTDRTGNDVLFQALKSVRTAVVIGSLASLATLPFAIVLGVLAGYCKGWVDDLIQYVVTVLSSIPSILLIAAFALMVDVYLDQHPDQFETGVQRAQFHLFALCLMLGITGWGTLCRLLRAETLKLSESDFVQAARAFGVGPVRIMARHVLPNLMHLVLIVTVLDFSALVLYEAVLSYVGVGVDPSTASFGTMINLARSEMARDPAVWWNLTAAFVFMLTLVLAANILADAVRAAFDPRAQLFRPHRHRKVIAA